MNTDGHGFLSSALIYVIHTYHMQKLTYCNNKSSSDFYFGSSGFAVKKILLNENILYLFVHKISHDNNGFHMLPIITLFRLR